MRTESRRSWSGLAARGAANEGAHHRAMRVIAAGLACAGLATGCGNAVDSEHKGPPLAQLQGRITNVNGTPSPFTLRVALVWLTATPLSGADAGAASSVHFTAQETAVKAQFPADFTLDLFQLPPAAAMIPVGGNAASDGGPAPATDGGAAQESRVATGVVVIYEDGNQNASLDFLKPSATAAIDRVMAAPGHALYYLEGAPVPAPGIAGAAPLQPGFNLIDSKGQPIPLGTRLSFALDPAPEYMELLCEGGFQRVNTFNDLGRFAWGSGPAIPAGATVTCSDDKHTARAGEVKTRFPTVCVQEVTSTSVEYFLPAGAPLPAGWPCP